MKKILSLIAALFLAAPAVAQVYPNPQYTTGWDNHGGLLTKSGNLSGIANPTAARTNLGLPASAATDTTNASNITSGTLSASRLPASSPLELTNYGVSSGGNANTALQAALTDCGSTGRPVHVAAGNYVITNSSNWPTANNLCPGIYGDGELSAFVIVDYNGPVIQVTVQTGVPQLNKFVSNLSVRGQWTSSTPAYVNSRLLNISGTLEGWSYSRFSRLSGYGVHDIVRFATPTVNVGGGLMQSNSGWNYFEGFNGQGSCAGAGCAAVIYPDSYVNYADSTSTGNVFSNFVGFPASAWVYSGGGASMMVGDLVFNGGQLGGGRVLYIAGSTCPQYGRTIQINGIQVDASSLEVVKAECGIINNIKINGNEGGSTPWAGINSLSLSDVHDLGEGHWGAGGPINSSGTGPHTAELWKVKLSTYTMTRIEVSVTGVVGGVGGGGVIVVYDCAYGGGPGSGGGDGECYLNTSRQIAADYAPGTIPAGWPAIVVPSLSSGVVTFSATYTDTLGSTLISNIKTDHGALKVQRGANVVF